MRGVGRSVGKARRLINPGGEGAGKAGRRAGGKGGGRRASGGRRQGGHQVDKMLRMLHTGRAHDLRNPSEFVTTGVDNAREVLTPEGEYYRGKGTNK